MRPRSVGCEVALLRSEYTLGSMFERWRKKPSDSGRGAPHTDALNKGNRSDSSGERVVVSPESWTDQQIVDSVRDTIESPDKFKPYPGTPRREVYKKVGGVWVRATYAVVNGEARGDSVRAYPVDITRAKGLQDVR